MTEEHDDGELVRMACAGDARAFECLLERHYDTVFRMSFKWCRNRSDAEDITQCVCIKLARAIHGYNGRAAFTSWLYRIVINTAIDWKRQNARGGHDDIDDVEIASAPVAETNLMAREVLAQIDRLPVKEKTALLLVVGEDMSHAEAASVMEVKESTVSWYVHEARKKLAFQEQKKERHHG